MFTIWSPSSLEIEILAQPNIFTFWLHKTTVAKEAFENEKIEKDKLVKAALEQKLMEQKLMAQKLMEQKLIEQKASIKMINHPARLSKSPTEIRVNSDGSICKFLS